MIGTSSRVALGLATAVLAIAGALGPAGSATAASGAPAADPAGAAALDSAVDAYLTSYPQMSAGQARSAALGQEKRKAIVVKLIERQDDAFGGAWFDPPTGTLHVAATNASAAEQAQLLARGGGVKLTTHLVSRSFTELERRADALRGGEGALGQAAAGQVGIDVTTNTVTVALPAGQLSAMTASSAASSSVPEGVTLVADSGRKAHPDAGCTSRLACDQTVRAGIRLWRSDTLPGYSCSAGFTARNASNQRIMYTAGHCSGGASALWGTGDEFIGGQGAGQDSGAVDALVVNITEQWFIGDSGGEIYAQGAPGFSVPIKGVATTLSFIVPGETVCLSANVVDPNGSNHCATVELLSDPGQRGLVRVKGYDACDGDSGGGWYWIPATVNRHAYGIHSRSDPGCLGVGTTRHSWFTAVPTAKAALAPTFNVELRP